MRILIFGAGVIGSLYAALLADAGYDVSVYARGRRLESLTKDGLLIKSKGKIRKTPIKVLSKLKAEDSYDLVFLTVRENQLHAALKELRQNCSPIIVTMVNSLETYNEWEHICGTGRIIPACGFDDKFSQVDNGKLRWFDVDLPDQIAVRRKVYEDRDRCIMMDGDALDGYWTSSIPKADSGYNRSDNKKSPAGSLIKVMIIPAGFLN